MSVLYKPSVQELDALKNEAMQGGKVSPAAWLKKMTDGYARILKRKPQQYRSFGPFWWLLKRELINHGHTEFGTTVDAEWYNHADYGDPVLNMLAVWTYAEFADGRGLLFSNAHAVSFIDDGAESEPEEYVLIDEEMETSSLGSL